jgi:hypothetical protein
MTETEREQVAGWRPDDAYLLAIVGRELHRATLTGNAPPMIVKLRERMRAPLPGDLVIEISRLGGMMPGRFDPDSIGRLIRIEPDEEGERLGDVRWVIEPLGAPGTEQGWQNAEFVALPDRHKWLEG